VCWGTGRRLWMVEEYLHRKWALGHDATLYWNAMPLALLSANWRHISGSPAMRTDTLTMKSSRNNWISHAPTAQGIPGSPSSKWLCIPLWASEQLLPHFQSLPHLIFGVNRAIYPQRLCGGFILLPKMRNQQKGMGNEQSSSKRRLFHYREFMSDILDI